MHVYRERNRVADRLAALGQDLGLEAVFFKDPPSSIVNIFIEDSFFCFLLGLLFSPLCYQKKDIHNLHSTTEKLEATKHLLKNQSQCNERKRMVLVFNSSSLHQKLIPSVSKSVIKRYKMVQANQTGDHGQQV
ncbi:hypothetical protein ACOSQ3_032631 [Xanthoceras sorbifolium]